MWTQGDLLLLLLVCVVLLGALIDYSRTPRRTQRGRTHPKRRRNQAYSYRRRYH